MTHSWKSLIGGFAVVLLLALPSGAQQPTFRQVANPFQEEYAYHVGDSLAPNVEVSGVRWTLVRVEPLSEPPFESGRAVKVRVHFGFDNVGESSSKVDVVLLFEDGQGSLLHRLECKTVKVRTGEPRTYEQTYKIQADVLTATGKLYVFADVE
jgi:hypothetical protein